MTDGEIVERILGGETARYEDLVDRYLPLVRGLCAGRVYDSSARDDLVQESFVQGYLHLDRLRDRNRFSSWLAKIAVNRCRQWLRGQGRHEKAVERLAAEPLPEPQDPADEAVRRELHEWIRGQVARLPEKTRDAMMLCYVEGLSIAEAARALGVRESAVKKRLQYGREVVGARLLDGFGETGECEASTALKARVLAAVPFAAAPWKGAGAATAVIATGGAAWLMAKAALVVVPLIMVGGVVAVWTQKPSAPARPAVAEASVSAVTRTEPATGATVDDAVPLELTVMFAGPGLTAEEAPAAANAAVRLEPMPRFDQADYGAMLRAAGAWEDWLKVSAGYDHVVGSGGQSAPKGLDALRVGIGDKIEALKARLGPGKMKRRFGNAAFPLQRVEFTTDGQGRASVRLRPGLYRAEQISENDAVFAEDSSLSKLAVSAEGPHEATVFVQDVASLIRGVVLDAETGAPPEFARIELSGEVGAEAIGAGRAAHEGRFSFAPASTGYGAFTVQVTSDTYLPAFVEGVRQPGVPTELVLRLQPMGSVSGLVSDPQGHPLPRASIWLKRMGGVEASGVARTDAEGRYTLRHDGGAVRLYASGVAVRSEEAVLQLAPRESVTQDFVLPASARAVFDIRTPDGQVPEELGEQQLSWSGASSGGNNLLRKEGDVYVIDYLSAGAYEATFLVPGFQGESIEFAVGPDLADVRRSIRLRPASVSAQVQVVDSRGTPKPQARVMAVRWKTEPSDAVTGGYGRTGSSIASMETDSAGMAVFSGLPEGEYSFECEGVDVEATVPVREKLMLALPDRPAQEPPRGYRLSRDDLRPVDTLHGDQPLPPDRLEFLVLTPSNHLTDGFVEPGENILFVGKSGYATAVMPFTLTEEMLAEQRLRDVPALHSIEVRFEQSGSLGGVVRDEGGAPVAGSEVRVFPAELADRYDPHAEYDPRMANEPADDMWRRLGRVFGQGARAGEDGAFQVDFLPPGHYLVVIGGDILNADAPLEVRAGYHTGPVELVRPSS